MRETARFKRRLRGGNQARIVLYYAQRKMAKIPTTSTTLLRDIAQDAQNVRRGEFVTRYRPMMEAFMRERFPSLEADDIIQETLVALCRVLPSYRYAPDEKGHFHNYLTGILRNKALRALLKREQDEALRADYANGENLFIDEQSYRESLFELALRQFLSDDSIADRTKPHACVITGNFENVVLPHETRRDAGIMVY